MENFLREELAKLHGHKIWEDCSEHKCSEAFDKIIAKIDDVFCFED